VRSVRKGRTSAGLSTQGVGAPAPLLGDHNKWDLRTHLVLSLLVILKNPIETQFYKEVLKTVYMNNQ
jgi:hypothetical protein